MKNIDKDVLNLLEKEGEVTLGFSTGKDSLACAVILQNLGIKFIPFFFYHCPDLIFVEDNIKMYEDILKIEVIRLPHPMLYDYLRHQDFQPPMMVDFLEEMKFIKAGFEDIMDVYFASIKDNRWLYDVTGVRASESFNRRMLFKQRGFIQEEKRKIDLIADWSTKDVVEFLYDEQVPLTPDYDIWRRSFDGLKYQFLFGVKKHYPNDWATIKAYFPLIELELFRYEKNVEYNGKRKK